MIIFFIAIIFMTVLFSSYGFNNAICNKRQFASNLQMHFDEAISGNTLLSSSSLKANRYLATNRFRVREKSIAKFEKRWADRKVSERIPSNQLCITSSLNAFILLCKTIESFSIVGWIQIFYTITSCFCIWSGI